MIHEHLGGSHGIGWPQILAGLPEAVSIVVAVVAIVAGDRLYTRWAIWRLRRKGAR